MIRTRTEQRRASAGAKKLSWTEQLHELAAVTMTMTKPTLVARTWRGAVRAQDADAYLAYVAETGLANYRSTPGNRGAMVLRRILGAECEFLILSLWDSREAIEGFAGKDIGRAKFYPEDDRFLVNRDLTVNHYEVVWSDLTDLTTSYPPS